MKKLFFTIFIFTISLMLFSQQVPRERVVVEVGTGTWCVNCPGAARGVEDLVANGHDVAVIEYHNGDPFANTMSNYRNNYYNVPGYPTATFDGVIQEVGGFYSGSMYPYYLPHYNTRIAIPSDYTVSIYGQNTSGYDYDVTVIIDLENGTPPTDLTAHLVLTESEIPYVWQGMTELNYVARAMYPDHLGTSVDFAGGDEVTINYSFSIDPSWVADHIELVAFVQQESSKEIHQGTMVPINNLIPLEATAGFSSSTVEPCEGTSVDFYDESLGMIISWEWTFEGGTPATSTEQNPTITYNTPGVYDVELTVDDGSGTSTLLIEDYITVVDANLQADMPVGPTDLCGGQGGYTYTTTAVPGATSYTWSLTPSNAGSLSPNGNQATLTVSQTYSGPVDIKVRVDNICGQGTWSDPLEATANDAPDLFYLSDGGSYCVGTEGVEVSLDGSETGVDYELYLDASPTGIIVAGDGNPISFGYQTDEGVYTVNGDNGMCQNPMIGTAFIYPIDIPEQAVTPSGSDDVCAGSISDYSTSTVADADAYNWVLDPPESGTITGNSVDASVEWSAAYTGDASVQVQATNACGDGEFSAPMVVTVNEIPEPVISGDDYVYENTPGHLYSSPDHAGSAYDWSITGGTITAGQGTHEITVTWGDQGTGYINLTETSSAACEGMAAEFVVTIDDFVGIAETAINTLSLYPNPADEALSVAFYARQEAVIHIQVINITGQVMMDRTETFSVGDHKTTLNIADLSGGYYTLKMIAEDGSSVQQKFIVMK